ncbi:hypothetical protein A3F37_00160 [Candidatus Saccharibacteria bacterium RIFCSPHIGHO2_12_FULL_41_12]|nr:MAG: hypothetical protein A3F37_00160 [Candidatus Saccharibacteria bacterium RIFCSPHIGHO2_12_FULL_41_12]
MNYSTQLKSILNASGWSQEQLAHNLNVSFATLNSWINDRSQPRAKALLSIEKLYLDTVGVDSVDDAALMPAKLAALKLLASPKSISGSKEVLDKLTLYLTYHTNTIEGSTMTLSDVEDVIFDHKVLSNRTAIEQTEARNHQATLHWLLQELVDKGNGFVIDEKLILGIHLRLMNGIISDAGQYRKHAVRIIGSHVALANWAKVPELVASLIDDLKSPSTDIIKVLAATHARFEKIHPFSDGNGRAGRLILLAQALKAGLIPPLVVKERKHAYYKYLELAQTKDDYMPLELFISESMHFTQELLNSK